MKFICLISLFSLFFTVYSNAQDFEVSPVKIYFTAEPGESQTRQITIKNHSARNTTFTLSAGDFIPKPDGTRQLATGNSNRNSISGWLTINPSILTINPNSDAIITVQVQAPLDDITSKWGTLVVQPAKEQTAFTADKSMRSGVAISAEILIYVFQSSPSNSNNLVKVHSLVEITQKTDTERKFSVIVDNQGDAINDCQVYLIAANVNTGEEKVFPSVKIETFPQSSRNLILSITNDLVPGSYSLSAIVDYGSKFSLEGTQLMIEVKP